MRVLLIDDNPDHARSTERALRAARPGVAKHLAVSVAADGPSALAHLSGAVDADALPDLVLLDLKMRGMHGLDVLQAIRSDPRLRTLPVIVLTSSGQAQDVMEAYRLGANEYVTKPVRPEDLRDKLPAIASYRGPVAQPPPQASERERRGR